MKHVITVLVGSKLHAVSGRPTANPGDAVAVALALALVPAREVRVLTVSAMPESVARDYLALGAARIDVLEPSGATPPDAAALLARTIDSELVFTGLRGEGGLSSGSLPYALAQALQRPLVADVVQVEADGPAWRVRQALPKGARRQLRLSVPAVLAISPSAPVLLRHSYHDQRAGDVSRTAVAATADNPRDDATASWQFGPAARQLKELQARVVQSGHHRMLGAIGSDDQRSSGMVLRSGGAQAKAQAILDYLREHSLVSF